MEYQEAQKLKNIEITKLAMAILKKDLIITSMINRNYQGKKLTKWEYIRYWFEIRLDRIKNAWLVLIGNIEIGDY